MTNINQSDTQELLKVITTINNLNLKTLSIDEIKKCIIMLLTEEYEITAPLFKKGLQLYRGVRYNQQPDLLSYLSYPPSELAQINRASREGESMFYCSNLPNTAFFELELQVGDKLVLSKWETTRPSVFNQIGYTNLNFKNLQSNRSNQIVNRNNSTEQSVVQDYFAETFSKRINENPHLYKLTIAIAEIHWQWGIIGSIPNILAENSDFTGLVYPTIQMRANADNFAIKPSFVDTGGLIFKEVKWVEVTNIYDDKYEINEINWANSINDKGVIEWTGGKRPRRWILDKHTTLRLTTENNTWVARDLNGNQVAPTLGDF